MSEASHAGDLSSEEVIQLLEFVQDTKPIVVGGQAINLWVSLLYRTIPDIERFGKLTSQDIDFLHNPEAEKALLASLANSKIEIAGIDDATPSAALITGFLNGKLIEIDFLRSVKGVSDKDAHSRAITIRDRSTAGLPAITLLHPLDCLKSRLSNVNTLRRTDEHSIEQAEASVAIMLAFLENDLGANEPAAHRRVTRSLQELEHIIIDRHLGKITHTHFGGRINPVEILETLQSDERLDRRWREGTLTGILLRVEEKAHVASRRARDSAAFVDDDPSP